MYSYQDYLKWRHDVPAFVAAAIAHHNAEPMVRMAHEADAYDHQKNTGINRFFKVVYGLNGVAVPDTHSANNKLACNFFNRLNTQRVMYSLGNGVSFSTEGQDTIKENLGEKFDTRLKELAYDALIHGVAFGFWANNQLNVLPITQFIPLWDETDSTLKAGIRFWRLNPSKPLYAVLYEEDGYTKFVSIDDSKGLNLAQQDEKRPYKEAVAHDNFTGADEVIGGENYSALPIVPMWGNRLHQSTLVGMQADLDNYDMVLSGFADDLQDCAQIYWLVENYGGMLPEELAEFRNRLKFTHIANADTSSGGSIKPYTQDIPYEARKALLDSLRSKIYEDFGGLDVHTIAAGSTNDHIDAAYQSMDEQADDFEYQVIEFVQQLLALQGVTEGTTPLFKRNRISNQKEQVEIVMLEAAYLDDSTILDLLPNITPDMKRTILGNNDSDELAKYSD